MQPGSGNCRLPVADGRFGGSQLRHRVIRLLRLVCSCVQFGQPWSLLLGLAFGASLESAQASNGVTNFTLYTRRTWTNEAGRVFPAKAPLRLSDFDGQIVFLEFFDPTCSDCEYAAYESVPGIGEWYKARKGSSNGLPVVQVHVNMVPQDFLQPYVNEFVDTYGIEICANDYNANPAFGPVQTNAVHDLFQEPFLKPLFVVINGVSNSLGSPQWSMLLNQANGAADWNLAVVQWRALMDGVQAPLPQLTAPRLAAGAFQFTFPGQRGRTNRVESSTDFLNWTVRTNVFGTNAPILFRDTNAAGPRFYRVRRL